MTDLMPFDTALERLLDGVTSHSTEEVSTAQAHGRCLASDLVAKLDHPFHDKSAMDGFAIGRAKEDSWQVVGESAAGHPFSGTLADGQAIRISTGASVPDGAAAVLPKEIVMAEDASVRPSQSLPEPLDRFIRRAGSDFQEGATLATTGDRIGPALLALALVAGHETLSVRRRVKLAILQTGDELVDGAAPLDGSAYPATNAPMLSALLSELPVEITVLPIAGDDEVALGKALAMAENHDVLVTIGGASVGDHDLVRPALVAWGAVIDFWRVAMKPGKPLMVARRGKQHIIGLPGNPVSSFVTARLFLFPLLRKLCGAAIPCDTWTSLPVIDNLPSGGGRQEFVRARWTNNGLEPLVSTDSGALFGLSQATHLIDRPIDAPPVKTGEFVQALAL